MSTATIVALLLIVIGNLNSAIGRSAINDEMLYIFIGLTEHAVKGTPNDCGGVICYSYYGETYHCFLEEL